MKHRADQVAMIVIREEVEKVVKIQTVINTIKMDMEVYQMKAIPLRPRKKSVKKNENRRLILTKKSLLTLFTRYKENL